MSTKIEWTDETWNPVVGCSKISSGCKNCYAIRHAHRLAGNPNPKIRAAYKGLTITNGGLNWSGEMRLLPDRLSRPLHWRKPRRVFVNAMSDLFHGAMARHDIDRVVAVMMICALHERRAGHTFQVLTKHADRMRNYLMDPASQARVAVAAGRMMEDGDSWHDTIAFHSDGLSHPSIWWGASVESEAQNWRIRELRGIRGPRFLSIEPLLADVGTLRLDGIDWVIVGGESGPGARPMHPYWVRSIREQCVRAGVPFFFKQWGRWLPVEEDDIGCWWTPSGAEYDPPGSMRLLDDTVGVIPVGKKDAGRELDGVTWDEMPEVAA